MSAEYFTKPFYLAHLFNVVAYLFLRKFLENPDEISKPYYYSITKEQMTFSVAIMLVFFRYKKYSVQEQMFVSLTNHLKFAILVNLIWSQSFKLGLLFLLISIIPLFFLKIPKYDGPSNFFDDIEKLISILFPYGNKHGRNLKIEREKASKAKIQYELGLFNF